LTTSRGPVQLWRGGSGTALVLLHDLGTSHRSFDALASFLLNRYHVCAPDLLGHGGSARDIQDLTVASQVGALQEILADLHFREVILVGHALGGSVALRVAATLPDLVRGIVLITAGSYANDPPLSLRCLRPAIVWSTLGRLGRRRRRRLVARVCGRSPTKELDHWDAVSTRGGWLDLGRAFRQNTTSEALSEMDTVAERYLVQPTLVVWGSDDEVSPVAAARVFFQDRSNVRLVEITGGGHAPHEEHPRIVADLIREFLE
jgi:pimeloyl-ACP methyl ester carboxylesterase